MLEAATVYIVIAIGKKLLDHASDDVGDAFDTSLRKLARWVREKVVSRPGKTAIGMIARAPAGKDGDAARDNGSEMLTSVLEEVTAGDASAARELEDIVTELQRLAPLELTVEGRVVAKKVTDGTIIGAESTGKLLGNTKINGTVEIDEAERVTIVGARNDGRARGVPKPGIGS